MKRILSVLIIACLLFSLCAISTSCSHRCKVSEEWSQNMAWHWHACADEECDEMIDKGDHIWDEGKITTEPTPTSEGIKTYTCTVCSYPRVELVLYES